VPVADGPLNSRSVPPGGAAAGRGATGSRLTEVSGIDLADPRQRFDAMLQLRVVAVPRGSPAA
jgi:hypothetical protein